MAFPVFNGNAPSWADLRMTIEHDGATFETPMFSALDWSDKVEPTDVYGQGATKLGTTKGRYSAEGKVTFYLTAAAAVYTSLAAVNSSITEVRFDLIGSWKARADDDPTRVELQGCRLVDRNGSNSNSGDAATVEHTLNVTKILVDGVCLLEEAA